MVVKRELLTERLRLVPCIDAHLEGLSAMNSDPEVMRYITGQPASRTDTQVMIERVKVRWVSPGYSWWTFIDLRSAEVVGAGCIQNLRRGGTAPDPACPLEIGWRVRRDQWGKGIATEAAQAMTEFAFMQPGADFICAVCHPDNRASIAVMVKLGMRFRGVEDWYAQKVTTYEITAADWRATHGTTGA
jgi:RimJ/RimL family protein N-acetyltransferase